MGENTCPTCQRPLCWKDGGYYCEHCQHPVRKRAFCPDCEQALEKLNACGAASYFCPHCNELKSKSRARICFEAG
ncbi:zinc ribbon domain-containing protein [Photobacterium atrarenae]|uniref:Zinc ribbon domain-containing protein n=1 Tax=Photobacterium atrarenae TaxID=865757 RepID=A0ABY5GD27_9GAMM|nr:zinc ribbon domain-containing protein [Photobacterium atrarenae]UTV27140.1 zinc ribbon domain-containing protein [Photobacterium atrarenae]